MVRGDGGQLYEAFRERDVAAIGWAQLAMDACKPGVTREALIALYHALEPQTKRGTIVSGASQVWRFVNTVQKGDWMITYSPANRVYAIGQVLSAAKFCSEWMEEGMPLVRKVEWQTRELSRDALSLRSKYSLGSALTVFEVPDDVANEILAILQN